MGGRFFWTGNVVFMKNTLSLRQIKSKRIVEIKIENR